MRLSRSLAAFLLSCVSLGFSQQPLTQQQACAKFSDAVVGIDAGGQSRGTGFIVSENGLIVTANHVIRNLDGQYYSAITVTMPDGHIAFADPVSPMSPESVGRDFALLRVHVKNKLPFLKMGSIEEVEIGEDAAIIGFPFSALRGLERSIKFCVSAEFAAVGKEPHPVQWTDHRTNTVSTIPVEVNVVYFQGPSIKGISGSPIISRETGDVVGVVSVRLTGIGPSLEELKDETAKGLGSGVSISGLSPGPVIHQILSVFDDQLANGLGAAVAIDPAKNAAEQAERQHK